MLRNLMLSTGLLVCCACSSTHVLNVWKAPGTQPAVYRKILVSAVFKDATVQRLVEDDLVKRLEARGMAAVAAYTQIPGAEADSKRCEEAVHRVGAAAVLLVRLVKVEQQTSFVPGSVPTDQGLYGAYDYSWFNGYYNPPLSYTYDVVSTETRLYDAATEQLVCSATLQTIDPRRTDGEIDDFTRAVLKSMTGNGCLR